MTTSRAGWSWRLTATVLTVSGCLGGASGPDVRAPDGNFGEWGELRGMVVDEEQRPVTQAWVTLEPSGIQSATGEDGSFAFAHVEIGAYSITAAAPGFRNQSTSVEVLAHRVHTVTLVLLAAASDDPRFEVWLEKGRMVCSFHLGGIAGSCGVGMEGERSRFTYPIEFGLWALLNEVTWQRGSLATGNRFSISAFPNATGSATGFCSAQGASPIRMHWTRAAGCLDPEWAQAPKQSHVPEEGGHVRSFMGVAPVATLPPPLQHEGVGLAYEQRFELWITTFYRMEAPPDYSALPDQ